MDHVLDVYRKRNSVAFWLLGLCNNFAYVIMLSAAKDILEKDSTHIEKPCRIAINSRDCQLMSTGSVLLADIVPALLIKITAPMFIHRVPFGMRHLIVVLLQFLSFLIVASSQNTNFALFGVVLASFGSGLGEITYLALTSNFSSHVVSYWSSGTGGAGVIGALAYALLTDPKLLNLTPKSSMLLMLSLPALFAYTYWCLLVVPHSVHRVSLFDPSTYLIHRRSSSSSSSMNEESEGLIESEEILEEEDHLVVRPKWKKLLSLSRFMIPLILVYFAEYYINQGLLELLEFDCAHGFRMSASSQYRWFQVIYQLGVFVSRSSSQLVSIPAAILPLLSVFQVANGLLFTAAAILYFLPHITIAFLLIFAEGLLGGAAYVNTFRAVHREVSNEDKEFSMGVVSISDTIGIVAAGFVAMPVHNYICSLPL